MVDTLKLFVQYNQHFKNTRMTADRGWGETRVRYDVSKVSAIFRYIENRYDIEHCFFTSLASKGFPSGYSKSVCVRPAALRKLRTYNAHFSNDA